MTHDEARCREIFALLSDYLDMELPPEACAAMETHIAGCSPCIEFAESLRKTIELCKGYEPAALPEELSGPAKERLRSAWEAVARSKAERHEH
jgi:anti-sigma factor RsiW